MPNMPTRTHPLDVPLLRPPIRHASAEANQTINFKRALSHSSKWPSHNTEGVEIRPHEESNLGTPKGQDFQSCAIPLCDVGNNQKQNFIFLRLPVNKTSKSYLDKIKEQKFRQVTVCVSKLNNTTMRCGHLLVMKKQLLDFLLLQ